MNLHLRTTLVWLTIVFVTATNCCNEKGCNYGTAAVSGVGTAAAAGFGIACAATAAATIGVSCFIAGIATIVAAASTFGNEFCAECGDGNPDIPWEQLLPGQTAVKLKQVEIIENINTILYKTTELQASVNTAILAKLYGNDITNLIQIHSLFNDTGKDSLGGIIDDRHSDEFLEYATNFRHGIKTSSSNVVRMMTSGHPLSSQSIWEANKSFCNKESLQYFVTLLYSSFILRRIALRMEGDDMSSREVTRFKRDLVNIDESFKSNCGVYAETLADCNNTWCYQEGTARQYTSCSSVSSDGYTCNNPTIRYGSTEGGVPSHPWGTTDDHLTSWCTQLLRRPSTGSVTRGVRSCPAPMGSVYWGTDQGNDEAGPRWLDSSDGNWRDSSLEEHRCNLFSYYITSLTCTSSYVMQRGNMIRTLPTIQKEYAISFKVFPTKFASGWHSVIHFTTGGDLDVYGSRIPGVWFSPEGDGTLYICSAVNGNKNFCYTPPIAYPLIELTEVRISQEMDGDDYFYTIKINGITVVRVQNNQPEVFSNVKVYVGDPWYQAQEGYIQDLVINTGS